MENDLNKCGNEETKVTDAEIHERAAELRDR